MPIPGKTGGHSSNGSPGAVSSGGARGPASGRDASWVFSRSSSLFLESAPAWRERREVSSERLSAGCGGSCGWQREGERPCGPRLRPEHASLLEPSPCS